MNGRLKEASRRMLVSAAMHLLVILGSLITWSHFFHSASEGFPPVVPVELVSLGEETNIAPMVREDLALDRLQSTDSREASETCCGAL
jgi:hypothetical protein